MLLYYIMAASKQIIYPKYALFIVLYACVFLTIGVLSAKVLDNIFPKFDPKKKNHKHKLILFLEVLLQVSAIAIITYVFREYVSKMVESIKYLNQFLHGSPDKFAALIIAPTMFTVQPSLTDKIEYLANSVV